MIMGLCALYPQYMFAFQLLVCLEVAGLESADYYNRYKPSFSCPVVCGNYNCYVVCDQKVCFHSFQRCAAAVCLILNSYHAKVLIPDCVLNEY